MSVKDILVVRSKEGTLVSKSRVPGTLMEAVKKQVLEALSIWDAERADFTVIRDPQYPVSVKLPITKDQYDLYSKFHMSRTSDGSVVFHIPVYIISFDNEYKDDNYIDKEVFVVAPALDQKVEEAVVELAVESTKLVPEEGEEDEDLE